MEIADMQNESDGGSDDAEKVLTEQDVQLSAVESGSEREEGELLPDVADVETGGNSMAESPEIGDILPEPAALPVSSPVADEEALVAAAVDFGESSSQVLSVEGDMTKTNAEVSENLNHVNNQFALEADQNAETVLDTGERTSAGITAEVDTSKEGSPSVTAETQAKQVSSVGKSSTTINLQERAKQRSILRQAGVFSPSVGRGRERAACGRGGRGQSSGGQA